MPPLPGSQDISFLSCPDVVSNSTNLHQAPLLFLYSYAFFQQLTPNYCHFLSCRGRLLTFFTSGSSPSSFPYHLTESSSRCIFSHSAHSEVRIPSQSHCKASLLWNPPTALFVTSPTARGPFLPSSWSSPVNALVPGAASHLSGILLPIFWSYSMSVTHLVMWIFILFCFSFWYQCSCLDFTFNSHTGHSMGSRPHVPTSLVMGTVSFRGIFIRLQLCLILWLLAISALICNRRESRN